MFNGSSRILNATCELAFIPLRHVDKNSFDQKPFKLRKFSSDKS
jgi:hypothetical protein